jgi:hypothetical protein
MTPGPAAVDECKIAESVFEVVSSSRIVTS